MNSPECRHKHSRMEDKFVQDEPMFCRADKRKDNLSIIQDIITNCSFLTIGLISFCSIGTQIL